jgi:phenylacetate-CoA ligase
MLGIQKHIRKLCFRNRASILRAFRGLLADQVRPLAEIADMQLERLNTLLNHACRKVPYYRRVLDEAGILKEGSINLDALEQLQNIPFLTKDIIRREKEQIFADDHLSRRSFINASGGSTGTPVEFLQDRAYGIADAAHLMLLKNWRGVGPYDSEIFLWGSERDTFNGKKPLRGAVGDFLRNRIVLNCFRMTPQDMERYIHVFNNHHAMMIRAYAEAIYEIARYARCGKKAVFPQKVIHTSAGNLYPFMREMIEEVFRCRVFDHYGSREVGSIASECKAHDGLHIMMAHNIVEIVDREGRACRPGEEGEIVITNLNNFSMPFIRYKIGDLGIMADYAPCPCGCNYPKLEHISGRVTDTFLTADGAAVSPGYFIHLIGVVIRDSAIEKFQVVQRGLRDVVVRIVRNGDIHEAILTRIEGDIKRAMGKDCAVTFEYTNNIRPAPSGKYTYTIREIGQKE